MTQTTDEMVQRPQAAPRMPYQAPHLSVYGSLRDLTAAAGDGYCGGGGSAPGFGPDAPWNTAGKPRG